MVMIKKFFINKEFGMKKRGFINNRKEDKIIDDSFVKELLYGKNDSTLSYYECSNQEEKLLIHIGKSSSLGEHIKCIDEILREQYGKEYEVSDIKLEDCDDYEQLTNLPYEEYNRWENF